MAIPLVAFRPIRSEFRRSLGARVDVADWSSRWAGAIPIVYDSWAQVIIRNNRSFVPANQPLFDQVMFTGVASPR